MHERLKRMNGFGASLMDPSLNQCPQCQYRKQEIEN